MQIEKINVKDVKEGDLIFWRVNRVSGVDPYDLCPLESRGSENFVYVLRGVEIEDKTKPQEDYSNLCGSVWYIPSVSSNEFGKVVFSGREYIIVDKFGKFWVGSMGESLSAIEVWLRKVGATRATDEDFIK